MNEKKKQPGKRQAVRLSLLDSLTLQAKYENGWSKWQSRTGAVYVFKHLPESDKQNAPVAQVYKDRHYLSGVFKTKNQNEFSGDILDKETKQRVFVLFTFEGDKVRIFQRI